MRIALFSSTADIRNGYGNVTAEYSRALRAAGVDVTLFLPKAQRRFHETYLSDIPARFQLPPYVFEFKNPKALLYLKTVDVSTFDLVHSLLDFPYCFVAARSARFYRKPFIMNGHGTYSVLPLLRFPDRLALEYSFAQARRIFVPSNYTRSTILQHTRRTYNIDVIHNGVHFDRFSAPVDVSDIRRMYEGKLIYCTVGGLKERKGQDLVLEALGKLKKQFSAFVYIMVGEGEWKTTLLRKAQECGVENNIVFTGAVDMSDLIRFYHACDVYVHTPRVVHYNFEGFGIVYLEAGAAGKPCLATDAGGVADAVLNGKTGYIVPDGDTDAIADRLLLLSRDHAIRARLGAGGQEYAKQHDWSLIIKKFVKIYEELTHTQ